MTDDEHGGNIRKLAKASGRPAKDLLDFSASINPLGPPEWLRSLISSQLSSIVHYPDPDCSLLKASIATCYGSREEEVLVGNGSSEIIYLLPRSLPIARALIPVPSYADYGKAVALAGKPVEKIFLKEEEAFQLNLSLLDSKICGDQLVFIGQPNNPTGLLVDPFALRTLALKHLSTIFVIDEAFLDFVEGMESLIQKRPPNVIILRSFTKLYAIPGLRLGFAIAEHDVIQKIRKITPPWSVNALAQAVGENAIQDDAYAARTRTFIREEREFLFNELKFLSGLTVYPGKANFLLVRIDRKDMDAPALAKQMISSGIAIRVCANFDGLDKRFFRVAVRIRDENLKLIDLLKKALRIPFKSAPARKKRQAIMFQGTSSNAGKSILTAAMCRILLQDGYRVAPFKSQNMSLNSFVTREGGEMGRAQVVQAQACRLDPDVRMNPILLKPSSDTGSQVILLGKPLGNMGVEKYIEYKTKAFETVKEAYDSLAREFDVIVLEGAGSPAEVNLKSHDIVNMKMADYAGAPVLLIGDIDRGGVFASFIGTWEVLTDWERKRLAGFIINRFRGDETLLDPAIQYTQNHTGLPFYGLVPYLHDPGLPEEDSVEFKSGALDAPPQANSIEIAVIDLPHISNFTDFDPFRIEPDVHLRIVRSPKDLDHPDTLILPGSKNVIGDLEYLRRNGLEEKIIGLAVEGRTEVVGICGGFQMLGQRIDDPHGIESHKPAIQGLGLLPITTMMDRQKTLVRAEGTHLTSGLKIRGYEIHHGQTDGGSLIPLVLREDGEVIGGGIKDHQIWGTYLHGIFDTDEFRRWFIDRLRIRHNLPAIRKVCAVYDLELALERLAEVVRRSLKIKEIYRLMGLR
ncbi:MAG: cobyric acid synthase [Deltaproteobacteria bacterium]|nr:cobyric acid synthase [Deltaproteobacteria bacterium]